MSAYERLEVLYRTKGPTIWRALVAFTTNPTMADDALSEAFAQALAQGDSIRDAEKWVWRVAFRVAAGTMKDLRRHRDIGAIADPAYQPAEPLVDVFDALVQLPAHQRLAVVLHDYADRPIEEIAATLGTAQATVYVHLTRGRRRLRSLLEDKDD